MSTVVEILRFFSNPGTEQYTKYLDISGFSRLERLYYENLDKYFTDTRMHCIPAGEQKEYYMYLVHKTPTLTVEDKAVLKTLCDNIESVSITSMSATLLSIVGRSIGQEILNSAYDIVESGSDSDTFKDIKDLCDKYLAFEDTEDGLEEDNWKDILCKYAATPGKRWSLDCLNRSLGERHGGEFIVIGARPDVGKTTLAVQEAVYAAKTSPDENVILFNNEEARSRVVKRIIQSATKMDNHVIAAEPEKAYDAYKSLIPNDNIKVVDTDNLSMYDIRRVIERYVPISLILFDQLAKVHVATHKGNNNEVQKLHELAREARKLSRRYAPVITTCWADAAAEGQMWVEQDQLYGVKTALQGEADAIITVGRSHEPVHLAHRFIYVPKNKCDGNVEKERNGKYTVIIHPEIAEIKDSV